MELQFILSLLLGPLLGAAGAVLAFRIRFERFESMDKKREESLERRLQSMDKRLDRHSERLSKVADHETRIGWLEKEVQKLRDRWHDLRGNTLEEVYELFRKWKDEMTSTFLKRKG